MTLVPMTKLEAVNELLEAIGESPVTSVSDTGLIEADMASRRIDKVSRQVQKRGWHWNTLDDYVLEPDTNGEIRLPTNVAEVKVDNSKFTNFNKNDYVQRGKRLYDRTNNTFNIGVPITVRIVLLLDFEELPENARDYVVMRASRKFQERLFGSRVLSEFDKEDEQRAMFDLLDAEADSRNYNMLRDSHSVARIVNRRYFNKD